MAEPTPASWVPLTQVNGTNMGAKARVFGSLRVIYVDGSQVKVTGLCTVQRHSNQFRLHYRGHEFGTDTNEVVEGFIMLPPFADWTLEESKIQTTHSRARVIHLHLENNNSDGDVELVQVTMPIHNKTDSAKSKFFLRHSCLLVPASEETEIYIIMPCTMHCMSCNIVETKDL
jgi:hypothetical protein